MKNKFKIIFLTALSVLVLFSASAVATSNDNKVNVQISPLYTEVECASVYNAGVEYPFITYKNITYLPLTKGVCERLHLASEFDVQKGFYIVSTETPYIEDDRTIFGNETQNLYGKNYTACIPSYPVYLNGIRINSEKEEYPFLNFRGVTYLPLTYKFAVEELNLNMTYSYEEESIKIYRNERYGLIEDLPQLTWQIDVGKSDGNNILLRKISSSYTVSTDEFNQKTYYPYSWYDTYLFNAEKGLISHLENTNSYKSDIFVHKELVQRPVTDKLSVLDNKLYYDGNEIYSFTNAKRLITVYGYEYEYEFNNKSLILADVNFYDDVRASSSKKCELLFLKENGIIKNLPLYDKMNRFDTVYPDGTGGAYVCTSAYLPASVNRWVSPYSTVYYLDSEGNFIDFSSVSEEINSIRAYGFVDGKLYVGAKKYQIDKQYYTSYMPISAINSGFYVIENNAFKRLYPYVEGEAFVTDDGSFYCVATYANKPRIINLKTGVITEID